MADMNALPNEQWPQSTALADRLPLDLGEAWPHLGPKDRLLVKRLVEELTRFDTVYEALLDTIEDLAITERDALGAPDFIPLEQALAQIKALP